MISAERERRVRGILVELLREAENAEAASSWRATAIDLAQGDIMRLVDEAVTQAEERALESFAEMRNAHEEVA